MWNVDTAQVVKMSHRCKNNIHGKNADLMQKLNGYQWEIQDFPNGACQPIIRPHFPENWMKINEVGCPSNICICRSIRHWS